MTATSTAAPSASQLQEEIEAKAAEIAARNATIGDLRARLSQAAIEGRETRTIRTQIRDAEDDVEDLGSRYAHLEGQLADARERDQHRAAYALLAEQYERDAEFLRCRADVRRSEDALAAARAAMPVDYGVDRSTRRRQIVAAWLGRPLQHGDDLQFADGVGDGPLIIRDLAGTMNNGGDTLAELVADITKLERLAAEAKEMSR